MTCDVSSFLLSEIDHKCSAKEKISVKIIRTAIVATKVLIEAGQFMEQDKSVLKDKEDRLHDLEDMLNGLSGGTKKRHGTRKS